MLGKLRASATILCGLIGVAFVIALASSAGAMPTITVADSGDPLVNGQNLVAAVAQAAASGPTASDPVDIELSAGVFDLDLVTVALPDHVNVVGTGAADTTVCNCAAHQGAVMGSTLGSYFETSGTNRIAAMTLSEGRTVLVTQTGGDLLVEDVAVEYTNNPDSGVFSPRRIADVADGTFEFRGSSLLGEYCCDTARGIVATGTSSIVIDDSTMRLEGFGTPFVTMGAGSLDVIDSNITGFGYDASSPITATGAVDMAIIGSTITARSGDFGSRTITMDAGGSLDISNSTINTSAAGAVVANHMAVRAVDVSVTAANSVFQGEINMRGGTVHVLNSDFVLNWLDRPAAFVLDDASGSMNGGSIRYSPAAPGETSLVVQGSGTMVLEGVELRNGRVVDTTICIDTLNENSEPTPFPAVPSGCQDGTPQVAYPDGPHAVPGSVEAENYDAAVEANVAFADSDDVNFAGAYRADAVDIWPTVGEAGFTVGRTRGGEWLEYSIDVSTDDAYDIGVRLATGFADPGSIRVSVDGEVVGTIDDVPIDGWWSWRTISAGLVDLEAGPHVVRLDILGNGQINLDRLDIASDVIVPPDPDCGGLNQEAETDFVDIDGVMVVGADSIGSQPGTPAKYSGFDGNDFVEYCVTASATGSYELDTIVDAADSASDSFFVAVNNEPSITWHIFPSTTGFETRTVKLGTMPVQFQLDAGENLVRFYFRESGTELDSFAFRSATVVCGGRERQARDGVANGAMFVASNRAGSIDGTPAKYSGFDGDDYVEYCVTVAEAGDYSITATVLATTTAKDSFFVQAGNGSAVTWHIPNSPTAETRLVRSVQENPARFALDAGDNIVRFYHRETGTELRSFSVNPTF